MQKIRYNLKEMANTSWTDQEQSSQHSSVAKKMRIIKEKWRKETEHDVNHRGIRRHHGDRGGNQGHQASDYRLPALRGSVAPLLHHPQPPKQQNVVLKNT